MAKKKQNIEEDVEEIHSPRELLERLGVKASNSARERKYSVYRIKWHPLNTIDHVKNPWARWQVVEDSPLFSTWMKANKHCIKMQKQYPDKLYEAESVFMAKSDIPEKLLKEILSLPWYNKD